MGKKTGPKGPWKMTPDTVKKLEHAFKIGASDREACGYAEISHQCLYNYQEKHPEFVDQKKIWKARPILKARQTVVRALETDHVHALKFLERKRKKEFSMKTEVEQSGSVNINVNTNVPELNDDVQSS